VSLGRSAGSFLPLDVGPDGGEQGHVAPRPSSVEVLGLWTTLGNAPPQANAALAA
jgi:hypothetical protein